MPRQSWQWAQAPPGRGSLLSLLYHFVPSVQHLPPVLWREGARRGIVRVCDACILRRCVLVAGVCVCTSATCVQQPIGLGTCLLNPRTLDSGFAV